MGKEEKVLKWTTPSWRALCIKTCSNRWQALKWIPRWNIPTMVMRPRKSSTMHKVPALRWRMVQVTVKINLGGSKPNTLAMHASTLWIWCQLLWVRLLLGQLAIAGCMHPLLITTKRPLLMPFLAAIPIILGARVRESSELRLGWVSVSKWSRGRASWLKKMYRRCITA